MHDLPNKINPCPIKEVVFEIRFSSDLPEDAIFGIVFNQFKDEYNNSAVPLPILEIPTVVRNQDPNLVFSPHYKMESEYFTMQVGPKVISLVNIKEYVGWNNFRDKILATFKVLQEINIIKTIDRVALRYINIFQDTNIYSDSNISVLLEDKPIESPAINLTTQMQNSDIMNTIRVISGAKAQLANELINGSIIDIDSSIISINPDEFTDILEKIHEEEKKLFYRIIGSEYLKQLNPVYS